MENVFFVDSFPSSIPVSLLSKWRILLVTEKVLLEAKYSSKKWGASLFKLVYQNS